MDALGSIGGRASGKVGRIEAVRGTSIAAVSASISTIGAAESTSSSSARTELAEQSRLVG